MFLLNPKDHSRFYPDGKSREIMEKTIQFFENKGKVKLKEDDRNRVWYADLLDFLKDEEVFYTLLTPSKYGDDDCRWDTWRNCEFNEILAFYGLHYWYTWQVTILGLGPLWMTDNEAIKQKTATLLKKGEVFAFGLSEKEHGADVYSSEMTLYREGDDAFRARGGKYYIGNANVAALVSTFGRMAGTDEYVFFAVDSQHEKFECIRNLVNVQSYVAEFALHDYPITQADILARGPEAWDMALNTVNVGKYNLGWASIGICTHALYEAINHAANRRLFNRFVTDFPHVQKLFVDAYTRLVAMKLFALRASDYLRSASLDDRRYLLFNPMVKMKVTMQGEQVIDALWDVIAARGFEKDVYFEMATRDIRALPKLEGTAHVNMALVVKFMANYLFNPADYPEIPKRDDAADDEFLFAQGPTKGLGNIQFHDYRIAYEQWNLPNVNMFKEQIEALKTFLLKAPPDTAQQRDVDFLLSLGEVFTLVPYGQLILENAAIYGMDDDTVDQIFDFMVRDFSKYALELYHKPSATEAQMELCLAMIRKPAVDQQRFGRVWEEQVYALEGVYEMND
ncbi:MAG: acyl-CoA dehydrogenase [Desulfarculaceae bacterium]|nr:acyl-CoA dehydrogenase [Desulfarculaceae bacterium]MCF8049275.1 acyl-CoA dehydrogenase [Desulfarculaceae bacterium]MCF8066195.1 acyl-CoA dehydrogenase [Desulfarculaceae bacterium]MCF8099764.1 acyl-CoA dehydrogenase [Desulfarculaceae bacterium]MCF8122477.1 acyl-CoA dehydrogenase [Desulfarculaceae bacterium]